MTRLRDLTAEFEQQINDELGDEITYTFGASGAPITFNAWVEFDTTILNPGNSSASTDEITVEVPMAIVPDPIGSDTIVVTILPGMRWVIKKRARSNTGATWVLGLRRQQSALLSGGAAAQGSATGDLGIDAELAGAAGAIGNTVGDVRGDAGLSANSTCASGVAASMGAFANLLGATGGICLPTAIVRGDASFIGGAAASSSDSGALTRDANLVGGSAGSSVISGAVSAVAVLAGTSAGASTPTGTLTGLAGLAGSSAGAATIGGVLAEIFSGYAIALDFRNGYYRSANAFSRDPLLLSGIAMTRAGAKSRQGSDGVMYSALANKPLITNDGLWLEESFTNLLLNAGSASSLSTQNVTVTAQAYTLSFIGTGTVTLSGTSSAGPLVGTGSNNRVSLTFTPTAGTLTLTVSGSVTYAGLVAGSLQGPIIATAGSTATAARDMLKFTSGVSVAPPYTLIAEAQPAASQTVNGDLANGNTTASGIGSYGGGGMPISYVRESSSTTALLSGSNPASGARVRMVTRFAVNDSSMSCNGQAVNTDASNTPQTLTAFGVGANSTGGLAGSNPNMPVLFVGLVSRGMSNAEIVTASANYTP